MQKLLTLAGFLKDYLKDPKDILAQPVTHISVFQDFERSWSTEISLTDLARISIPSF